MSAHDLVQPEAWQEQASCRGAPNPGLWFPERGDDLREAKAICAQCPVQAECLDYALKHRINEGIWGGESERARRRMRGSVPAVRRCGFCGDRFEASARFVYCSDGCRLMAKRRASVESHRRVS